MVAEVQRIWRRSPHSQDFETPSSLEKTQIRGHTSEEMHVSVFQEKGVIFPSSKREIWKKGVFFTLYRL